MIDSHSHTSYSKHATGTVDELVRASIAAGVTNLTITDHAPFPVDTDNRLLASELDRYFADIERARKIYQGQITICAAWNSTTCLAPMPSIASCLLVTRWTS